MKRYALFAGEDYYPSGGWDDFIADADSVSELMGKEVVDSHWQVSPGVWHVGTKIEFTPQGKYDWWQIIDTETKTKVAGGGGRDIDAKMDDADGVAK